ncbi:5' nucleotidase, NT5C type [Weissella confusa]|uniref:5' nucleotidase, NT5C type n=1 Tax=Weissella confusa TaxID=1583 RepID=UPI0022FF2065|nr:hypothetical protein [Weissella confusa]MDA5457897.1 5'(3')-deoxyribonucleotidase [Weissella confusa]
MNKPKLFLDMDNVLVDTLLILNAIDMAGETVAKPDQIPGIFRDLPPVPGAIDAVNKLNDYYELYILSTAPWQNVSAWQDKLIWLQHHFGDDEKSPFYKRVILAHDKSLARTPGGILVDDRPYHGASGWDDAEMDSQWIQYGYESKMTWQTGLVDLLIEAAEVFKNGDSIRNAVDTVMNEHQIAVHGDTEKFVKAAWE